MKDFYNKDAECENCNSKRRLKLYYYIKVKMSNQRKIYYKQIEIIFYSINIPVF